MSHRPVIAIAGLACETSTFTPSRTLAPAFHPVRGDDNLIRNAFLGPGTPLGAAADWRGILTGHALPGGIVTRAAFEELAGEIVSRLQELVATTKLDGLWFDIHGAMVVEGLEDIEYELLAADPCRDWPRRDRICLDGPARECVARAGTSVRPHHVLSHGAA